MTVRSDDAQAHSVSPWKHTRDSPPHKFKYHCQRTSPIAIDPFDHNTVYYGCQRQNHELTKNDVICRADPHQSIFGLRATRRCNKCSHSAHRRRTILSRCFPPTRRPSAVLRARIAPALGADLPMAWSADWIGRFGVIEVYPAAPERPWARPTRWGYRTIRLTVSLIWTQLTSTPIMRGMRSFVPLLHTSSNRDEPAPPRTINGLGHARRDGSGPETSACGRIYKP
jgi:hypothetical protein